MQFTRIGDNTIRCIITEEEITDLGYTIDDILGNAERTQEFMNEIFDLAEQQFGMKFEMGVRTVRADFLPDHTVSLTFSENQAQKKVNGFVEHLLEYVNQMLGESKEKLAKLKELSAQQGNSESDRATQDYIEKVEKNVANGIIKESEAARIVVLLQFEDMNVLCRYVKNIKIPQIPDSTLYKLGDRYFLKLDLTGYTEEEVLSLSVLTDEYAMGLLVGDDHLAYFNEHGDVILESEAIESLRQI